MVDQQIPLIKKAKFPFENAGIDVLDLSIRFRHALMRNGIHTIYDLVMHLSTLNEVPQIGQKAHQEIKVKLVTWVRGKLGKVPAQAVSESTTEGDKKKLLDNDEIRFNGKLSNLSYKKETIIIENCSIDLLNLSPRTKYTLTRPGINTIYDLVVNLPKLNEFRQIGKKTQEEIKGKLIGWINDNLESIPPQVASVYSTEIGIAKLSREEKVQIIDLFLVLNDRQEKVLTLMFGLESGHTMTLQETSDRLGITRERVRQIKNRALVNLHHATLQFNNLAFCEKAAENLARRGGVLSETRLADELSGDPVLCGFQVSGILEMIKNLRQDHLKIYLVYLDGISGWTTSEYPQHLIDIAIVEIRRVVEHSLGSIEWMDLYSQLLQNSDLFALNEELALAVAICLADIGVLDRTEDGRWMVKGTRKSERRDQLVDVLLRIGHPAHFNEILRIHRELFADKNFDGHAVLSIMQRWSDIFSRVGRGKYGLIQWGLGNDGTIANSVRRILVEKGEPMPLSEIRNEVLKTWQVEDYSVYSAIFQDARFIRTRDGKIALTKMGHTVEKIHKRSDETRRDRLVEVLRSIQSPAHFKVVAKQHNECYPDTPLTETSVYMILNSNQDLFVRAGAAFFGLTEWGIETKREEIKPIDRLISVLTEIGRPASPEELNKVYQELFPDVLLSGNTLYRHIYQLITRNSCIIHRVSRGTYGLVEWDSLNLLGNGATQATRKPELKKSPTDGKIIAILEVESHGKPREEEQLERVVRIFTEVNQPISVAVLRNYFNKKYPDQPISPSAIYSLIKNRKDIFNKRQRGFYGLVAWGESTLATEKTATRRTDTRLNRIQVVFREFNQPTRAKLILKRYNELYPDKELKESGLYSVFFKHKDKFVRIQKGAFALEEWEHKPLDQPFEKKQKR